MRKKLKKPRRLSTTEKPRCFTIPPGGIIAGFPEFWQKSHSTYARFFEAVDHLNPLVNEILERPVSDQLPRILHYMMAIISNSLGSLITLALNGYGYDAVRIARGMFETSVNASYLAKHPPEVENYLDYYWIKQRKFLDYVRRDSPQLVRQLTQSDIDEIDREFAKVAPKFKDQRGRVRREWCAKNLRERAEAVGMGELYPTFYALASSIHHGDFSGLASQVSAGRFEAHVAPSFFKVKEALMMGHQSVLVISDSLNGVGKFGLDAEVKKAADFFHKAWS